MTITSFDKKNLSAIRVDIDAALKAVATKYNMKLELGNIRYQTNSFKSSLTAAIGEAAATDENSSGQEVKWRTAFLRNCFWLQLDKSDLDKEITLRGTKFQIAGARPKAVKPIVLKDVAKAAKGVQTCYIAASSEEVKAALGK